jgi:hypothetical protein
MTAPADPRSDVDTLVEFRIADVQPGNVVPALARLLIDLARRQDERTTTDDIRPNDESLLR